MFWIISGPSCVGKTTFIEKGIAERITKLPKNTPIVFPSDLPYKKFIDSQDVFFHYNILRPCHFIEQFNRSYNFLNRYKCSWRFIRKNWNYAVDGVWINVHKLQISKKAIILATSQDILLQRARKRTIIEKEHQSYQGYPQNYWINVYKRVKLSEIYETWLKELQHRRIDYVLINSTDDQYETIHDLKSLYSIINS